LITRVSTGLLRHWRTRAREYPLLPPILILSLTLNLWGNRWGAPDSWHPDEVVGRSIRMVSERTLNPGHFSKGGLHYYVVATGAVIPVLSFHRVFQSRRSATEADAPDDWQARHRVRIIQLARAISAALSTLTVAITIAIGAMLFDTWVGYLAGLFLTLSMYFVAVAHFATVDADVNYLYWLSCVFGLLVWKRGDRVWYGLAGITAGLAIGAKIDRLVLLIPLLSSHLLRREGLASRRLLLLVTLVPVGFVMANPMLVLSPFEFLDGFTRSLFFNYLRGNPGPWLYVRALEYMKAGLGVPLFWTAVAGTLYGVLDLLRARVPAQISWLLLTFVPYYVVFGSRIVNPWYVVLLFPGLMILAARVCVDAGCLAPKPFRLAAGLLIAGVGGYSFLYTCALLGQFTHDSRSQAVAWFEQHAPLNASVVIFKGSRAPTISRESYRVHEALSEIGRRKRVIETRNRLIRHPWYRRVRRALLRLEQWTRGYMGSRAPRTPHSAWFDSLAARYDKGVDRPTGISAIEKNNPDYVFIVGTSMPQTQKHLKSRESKYRLAAMFQATHRIGIRPAFPFVSPPVYIYRRDEAVHQPPIAR
jgi:hypothetical protein